MIVLPLVIGLKRVEIFLRISFDIRKDLNDELAPKLKQDLFYNMALKHIIRNYFEVIGSKNSLDIYYDSYFSYRWIFFPKLYED